MQSIKRFSYIFLLTLSLGSTSCNSDAQNTKEVKQYYDNGQLKATGFIQNGKKNGNAKLYYQNDKVKQEGQWKDDKQEGIWTYYYDDGTVSGKVNFKTMYKMDYANSFTPTETNKKKVIL